MSKWETLITAAYDNGFSNSSFVSTEDLSQLKFCQDLFNTCLRMKAEISKLKNQPLKEIKVFKEVENVKIIEKTIPFEIDHIHKVKCMEMETKFNNYKNEVQKREKVSRLQLKSLKSKLDKLLTEKQNTDSFISQPLAKASKNPWLETKHPEPEIEKINSLNSQLAEKNRQLCGLYNKIFSTDLEFYTDAHHKKLLLYI